MGRLLSEARKGRSPATHANVALLNLRPKPGQWHRFSFYLRIMEGMRSRAHQLRLNLDEIFLDDQNLPPARVERMLLPRGVRGLIAPPLKRPELRIDLDGASFAMVAVGYNLRSAISRRVAPDNHHNLQLAWSRLEQAGARRIGLALHGPIDLAINHAWTEAYRTAQIHGGGGKGRRLPLYLADPLEERRLGAWLRRHRPDAIIFGQKAISEATRRLCADLALTQPLIADLNWHPGHQGLPGVDQELEAV